MTIICVQVRLTSKRCPKKALADLHGKPLIVRLTERVKKSGYPVVWCTSEEDIDNPLETLGKWYDIPVVRGHVFNIPQRFLIAANMYQTDTVVRVTGDNPLTDPAAIKSMVEVHLKEKSDYAYVDGVPRGTKPEVISRKALEELNPTPTEHLTWYLQHIENQHLCTVEDQFKCRDMRLTVDTPEDLQRMRKIYDHFNGEPPSLDKIIQYAKTLPGALEHGDMQSTEK